MTVRTTIQVHFDAGDVSHRHMPTYSTLELASDHLVACLFISGPDVIDEVIAELTALRAEMTGEAMGALAAAWPPVPAITVTDDEPEDHPDTAGPAYGEAELRRADAYRDHPAEADGLAARAALAASVAAGVPLTVYDDEPRCGCGHQQTLHDEGPDSRCNAVACRCARFSTAASVTR